MGKTTRQIKRKAEKKKNKELNSKLSSKLNMFDRLPSQCVGCDTDYDRKNRVMAASWRVVVVQETVKLFCPDCWQEEKGKWQ